MSCSAFTPLADAGGPRGSPARGYHCGPFGKGLTMPDFSQLTERQREIYDFIRDKIESRGFGPTVREIGDEFGIKSPNGVMCHLKALEKKGLIIREEHSARAIQLVDHHPMSAGLPL